VKTILPTYLELDLPDGRGVHFPSPVLPLADYCEWLQGMHEDRVRRGMLAQLSERPERQPVDVPFRLD
jgi:hypothetical protein